MKDATRIIPEHILDDIYISLVEAYERIELGTLNIKRCINYFENEHGYKPPNGYKIKEEKQKSYAELMKPNEEK